MPSIIEDTLAKVRAVPGASTVMRFTPARSGEHVFYLGTPNIPFAVRDLSAAAAEPIICSRYVSDALATELTGNTCTLRGAYVVSLKAFRKYEVGFGPTAGKYLTALVTHERFEGATPSQISFETRSCSAAELSPLTRACVGSADTHAVNGVAFGNPNSPSISLEVPLGVHLVPVGSANEGAVELTAPYTDNYLISLGTPGIALQARGAQGPIAPLCGGPLTAAQKSAIVGSACDPLRGAVLVRLEAAEPTRIELGRIAPNSWVRLVATASSPDSDHDGVSDLLDACPADATETVDSDGDSICNGKDNCPTTPNYDQLDSQGDGQGDACRPAEAKALSAGGEHTCALMKQGAVKCWGRNDRGALGLGDSMSRGDDELDARVPAVDLGTGRRALSLSARGAHACAVLDDGSVKCWGANDAGGLGLGDSSHRGDDPNELGNALPRTELGTRRTALSVSAGTNFACALLDDHTVKCWGANNFGQLGLGDTNMRGGHPGEMGDALPRVDLGTGRSAVLVRAGAGHACALLDDQTLKCWGSNSFGELGLGDTQPRGGNPGEMGDALPVVALGSGHHALQLELGSSRTCAILDDASVKCWGDNELGQLGLEDGLFRGDRPGQMGDALPRVKLGSGRTAVSITMGGAHSCALLDNQRIKCWGDNGHGQLGLGDRISRGGAANEMGNVLPSVDLGTGRLPIALTAGDAYTCALFDDAGVKCWGFNMWGMLGLRDVLDRGGRSGQMGDALPLVQMF